MVFLYRERGAIGAASHWSESGGEKAGLEFLGLGRHQPESAPTRYHNGWPERIIGELVAVSKDILYNKVQS
jgi:hypothetical protein